MDKYFKYDWDNKNQLINDLKQSTSMSDFLKSIGLTATSANFHTFKKKIKKHNIDLSEIYKKKVKQKRANRKSSEILDEEVFCINSKYDREFAKHRIIQKQLIPYICTKCHNNGFWMNEILPLQLEHKNGNNFDNRLENLEYLCPNCHVQTATYGSKNKHLILLNKRIESLQKHSVITDEIIEHLVFEWKIKNQSVREWLLKHELSLNKNNIVLDITRQKIFKHDKKIELFFNNFKKENISLEQISTTLNLDEKQVKSILEIYAPELFNAFYKTSKIDKNIVQNVHEIKISKDKEKQAIETKKIIQEKVVVIESNTSRQQDALALSNKKQLPELAKKWGISVNAVKKWIRNNLPEHFDIIFDEALLVKNQKKSVKENYYQKIAQLNFETFNLQDFMTEHQIKAKASAYSLIKTHNPDLYEKLMPAVACIYCEGKTRTAGSTNTGEKIRYRCLDCDKSFTSLLLQTE